MRLRLSIGAGQGAPTTFEHAGPVVRIGRDPACELPLQGTAGDAVSRRHAQIELGDGRATITDVGSKNGTLLNGALLKAPAPLRVGDEIQLGFTGAMLTVLALDLGAARRRTAFRQPVLIGAVAAAIVAVLSGMTVFPRLAAGKARTAVLEAAPTVQSEASRSDAIAAPPALGSATAQQSAEADYTAQSDEAVPLPPLADQKPSLKLPERPRLVPPSLKDGPS
jgi:pSer/pThr/pTyr-binding forkhead associated (FHA) protein